ncbi:MAG: hypothetical protein V1647_01760, partial [Pseudomonadota bacterium]
QLELKMLVNEVEWKLGEEGYINPEILKQVSKEIETMFGKDFDPDSDEIADIYTSKLYEKTAFNKIRAIYNSMPKNMDDDYIVPIYIELKKILEFCEEHNVQKAEPMLNAVNKVLFEHTKDVSSGVAVISKMLENNSHIKTAQYLIELSHLIETSSMEMDTLFEAFIKYISTQKLSPLQFKMYAGAFKSIQQHPQFEILYELLICFHENEKNLPQLARCIVKNINIFRSYAQTFYVIVNSVIKSRLKTQNIQTFAAELSRHDLDISFTRTMLYVLTGQELRA